MNKVSTRSRVTPGEKPIWMETLCFSFDFVIKLETIFLKIFLRVMPIWYPSPRSLLLHPEWPCNSYGLNAVGYGPLYAFVCGWYSFRVWHTEVSTWLTVVVWIQCRHSIDNRHHSFPVNLKKGHIALHWLSTPQVVTQPNLGLVMCEICFCWFWYCFKILQFSTGSVGKCE